MVSGSGRKQQLGSNISEFSVESMEISTLKDDEKGEGNHRKSE